MSKAIKTALITGASSGIGEATARYFAQQGIHVVLAARTETLLHKLCEELKQAGGKADYFVCDLAKGEDTSKLVEFIKTHYGCVDVLVNNAGYGPPFPLEHMSREQLRHVFDVNLLSGAQLISEFTPLWREAGEGRVVNVSSLSRYVSAPVAGTYAATKAAMETLSDCLRLELAPWNISLSLVIPGFVDTPTFDKSRAAGKEKREDPTNPYKQWLDALDDFSNSQVDRAISAEAVAQVIYEAATANKPKHRYFVPKSAGMISAVFSLLPSRLVDKMLLKMYGWGG